MAKSTIPPAAPPSAMTTPAHRLRLRGLSGAHDEFPLAATSQNLRRMAKRLLASQQGTAEGLA